MSKKPARPYVTKVTSNLKSPKPEGEPWSTELGRYTLLVGSNTSHKSSVIQAVELAVSGTVDDVVGRNDVKTADLLLSLTQSDRLFSRAVMGSSEKDGSFVLERKGDKNKRAVHHGPGARALTHRAVKDALSGSADTRRKAFLGWIGDAVSREDIFSYIYSDMHAVFHDLWSHMRKVGMSDVDTLLAIKEYTNKQCRDLMKEKRGAEGLLDKLMTPNLGVAPEEVDIEKLDQAVKDAQALLEAAAACSQGMPESLRQSQMTECEEEMSRLNNEITQIGHQIESLESQVTSVPDYVKSGLESLEWAVANNIEQCPTCSSQVGMTHLVNCRDFFSKQVESASSVSAATLATIDQLTREIESLQRNYAKAEKQLVDLSNTPSRTDAGLSIDDARDRLNAATQALNTTQVNAAKWAQIKDAQGLVQQLDADIENYKRKRSECDNAVMAVLETQREEFVKAVRSHLPDGWLFDLVLRDAQEKDVFKLGLLRNGTLHEALSGAEWATVTTAVAMAVVEMGKMDVCDPAILIPEDRAWDGKTLSSVMRSFRNFEGQVIMASTIRPTGRAPAGWTIIDMDKESTSWLGSDDEDETPEPEPAVEVRKDSTIRRPKNGPSISTASVTAIESMGFTSEQINLMSKTTAADIIKERLKPDAIEIQGDGGYTLLKADEKTFDLPPAPSR